MMQVKGNQPSLLATIVEHTAQQTPYAQHTTQEKGHGREEKRCVMLYDIPKPIKEQLKGWTGIEQFVKVHRTGIRNQTPFQETAYFITSTRSKKVKQIAKGIRGHWGIENRLHWVKDVVMNEDNNKIKGNNAPENQSILKNIAINIYRNNGHQSIKYATIAFANLINELMQLIIIRT